MKIECVPPTHSWYGYREEDHPEIIRWRSSVPFAMASRGKLVHRVRNARTYTRDGRFSHHSCTFWCGNVGRLFFEFPPEGRLLCAACEAKAVAKGFPTADVLAGRHVCIGTLKVRRLCCTQEQN